MGSGKVSTMTFYYHPGLRVKTPHLLRLPVPMSYDGVLTIEHPRGESAWASAGGARARGGWRRAGPGGFAEAGIGRANIPALRPTFALGPKDRSAARGAVRKALRHSRRIYRATARWHVGRKNTVKITL